MENLTHCLDVDLLDSIKLALEAQLARNNAQVRCGLSDAMTLSNKSQILIEQIYLIEKALND